MMKDKDTQRKLIPAEPVIILTLIGLMLTGALLYYRSVNLQRFLEPALAVLEPRTRLASRLGKLASEELGIEYAQKIVIRSSSIMVHKSLFTSDAHHNVPVVIGRLSRMMFRLFEDPWMASNIEMIMVKTSVPINISPEDKADALAKMRKQSEAVLKAILGTDPALATGYSDKFAATTVFSRNNDKADWLTMDIIPSERLHIEVLERLGKYAHKPLPTN